MPLARLSEWDILQPATHIWKALIVAEELLPSATSSCWRASSLLSDLLVEINSFCGDLPSEKGWEFAFTEWPEARAQPISKTPNQLSAQNY